MVSPAPEGALIINQAPGSVPRQWRPATGAGELTLRRWKDGRFLRLDRGDHLPGLLDPVAGDDPDDSWSMAFRGDGRSA